MRILNRLKNSWAVLLGNKKAVPNPNFKQFSIPKNIENLTEYTAKTNIEFVFAEFGEDRVNAGDNALITENRLDPTLSSLKKYFPNAKYTVYSDFDLKIDGVTLRKVVSPIPDKLHPRFLYRTSMYFKFKGLVNSDADFCCALDTDMFVCNENIYRLLPLTEKFGFCVAYNVRNLLKRDMEISLDAAEIKDLSGGFGHSFNQSPMTLWKNSEKGKAFYEACAETMIEEPSRASLVMWKASWKTGLNPYLLPQQFCVCTGQENIGDEVFLHIGHKSVADFYNIKL